MSGLQTYEQRRSKSPSYFKVSLSLEKKKVLFISIVEEGKIENVLPHPLPCLSISEIANQDMIFKYVFGTMGRREMMVAAGRTNQPSDASSEESKKIIGPASNFLSNPLREIKQNVSNAEGKTCPSMYQTFSYVCILCNVYLMSCTKYILQNCLKTTKNIIWVFASKTAKIHKSIDLNTSTDKW